MIQDFIISNPKTSVILISFLATLAIVLVTKFFTNQTRVKEIKAKQKELNQVYKDHMKAGNKDKMAEIQKEILEGSMEMMKHSMKPMIFTFLPLIILFGWIRGIFAETAIAGTWLWWYIGSGLASSIILRKVLDVA